MIRFTQRQRVITRVLEGEYRMIKKKLVAILVAVAMILQGGASLVLPSYASAAKGDTKTVKAGTAAVAVTAPEEVADDFVVAASAVKKETTDKIAGKVKQSLTDKKTVEKTMAFDVSVKDGDGHAIKLENKKSTFTLSFKGMGIKGIKKENVSVYHVGDGVGTVTKLAATVDGDDVKISTSHFSTFAVVALGDAPVKKEAPKKAEPKKNAKKINTKKAPSKTNDKNKDSLKDTTKDEKAAPNLKEGEADQNQEKTKFTVTFDYKNDGKVEEQTVEKGKPVDEPEKPTKKGYLFKYWANSKDNNPYDFNQPVNEDLNLYAVWDKEEKFTVSFVTNGGSPAPKQQEIKEGDKAKKPTNPTRRGYGFVGWYDKNGKAYDFGTEVTSSFTLYAKWNRNSYKIYFKANKGNGSMSPQSMKYDISKKLKTNRFTKKGHRFTGWTTSANGNGKRYSNGQGVINLTAKHNGKVTLYAQWQKKNYRITYDLNGGSFGKKKNNITQVYTYGQTIKVIGAPTKAGYQFQYWRGSAQYKPGSSYVVRGKETLTAQWKKINGRNGNGQLRNGRNNKNGQNGKGLRRGQNGKKTGDDRMLVGLILIAAASGTAAVVIYRRRKKNQ